MGWKEEGKASPSMIQQQLNGGIFTFLKMGNWELSQRAGAGAGAVRDQTGKEKSKEKSLCHRSTGG